MVIVHLMASPFFGGPEKQMLGMARRLPASYRSVFLTFAERGLSRALLQEVHNQGFEGIALKHNAPHLAAAVREVVEHLRKLKADMLCCSGYKPDIIGLLAARRVGIPIVSVAHGWTAATWKVRVNEMVDRFALRWMDKVVCVSEAQAMKVRRAGIASDKVTVIHNAVGNDAFAAPDPAYRDKLRSFFKIPVRHIVGAAGRLSPEKGFDQLALATPLLDSDVGVIVFGDGPLRNTLVEQIRSKGLQERFILAGFHEDATKYFAYFDVLALPSYTEGLPVVLLEAMAAGVPVVATRVGGVPEVVEEGSCGHLVAPGDPAELASRITDSLKDAASRDRMGSRGKEIVHSRFTSAAQGQAYQRVFDAVCQGKGNSVFSNPLRAGPYGTPTNVERIL